jgi:peroxiredoxin
VNIVRQLPGDRVRDFTLPNQRGVMTDLAEARSHGPLVLVLDGRVAAARHRLDELARAWSTWRNRGVALVVVLADRRDRVRRHIEETGLPFNILVDEEAVVQAQFGLPRPALPGLSLFRPTRHAAFVIGRDGAIVARIDGGRDMPERITQALARITEVGG